ncbi:MAG: MATE family efflux transporter [Gemmatimonadaceae bacterium]|nr:MATE family efflux transporter [Gemmatimonadaceae bacterium]
MARLAAPIVAVQVGLMTMGAVDAAMLGRVSPAAMAGGALGNLYWMLATMVGQGAVHALDPIVSQALGAGDAAAAGRGVKRGLVLGALLSLPAALVLVPAEPVLRWLGQPEDVAALAGDYTLACVPGTIAYYWFFALRQSLQAMRRVWPLILTVVGANLLNVFLDWVLIFGRLGAPALGTTGAAIATSIGRWAMVLILGGIGWRYLRPHLRGSWRSALRWTALTPMLRIGLPIGVHQWLEMAAFGGALLLVGRFGTVPLAAHNLTIQIVALTYMVPLGTASAAAVLVGHAVGRGDADGARREASAALVCGVGFMAIAALVIVAVPETLARAFSIEPAVVALGARFLPIAAAFQVFDGIQGVSSGILRGLGDTRIPMLLNLVGFVLIGIPVAAILAFPLGIGPEGVWWGLVVCLAVVAALLAARVRTRLSGALVRVESAH